MGEGVLLFEEQTGQGNNNRAGGEVVLQTTPVPLYRRGMVVPCCTYLYHHYITYIDACSLTRTGSA